MAWGATVPMIAHAAGIELDDITTTWEKWVTPEDRKTVKGVIEAGNVAAIRFTINGVYAGREVITLEHVNRIGLDAAPDWPAGSGDDVYRVDIEGSPSISQETAFRFTDGSGRAPAVAGCLATGMRALNAVPAVNDLPAGWVTAARPAADRRGRHDPLGPLDWAHDRRRLPLAGRLPHRALGDRVLVGAGVVGPEVAQPERR